MVKKNILSVSSLSFSYGQNKILNKISFNIKEGDFIALIGPNGSGKTTLVKLLLGLVSPSKGSMKLFISKDNVGYVPQRYTFDKNFPGTVEEILSSKDKKIIDQTGIHDLLPKKFISLSGGQQQRVLIALALQKDLKLLILDEPTKGVDVKAQKIFYNLLKRLNKKGITIILVTHRVGVLSSLVRKVICIHHQACCVAGAKEMPKLLKEMYGEDIIHQHHKGGHYHD